MVIAMLTTQRRQKVAEGLWYLAIFLFFFFWFSQMHPLVVYDADDWTYLAYVRSAAPEWGGWNPAKVFPEVMMPFFSNLGLYFLLPLVGDYITTFTITHALVVSGFLTVYFWSLACLIRRLFSLPRSTTALVTAFFFLLHFLVLRKTEADNSYLFNCGDLNCYYNYLIPGLMNASFVLYLLANPRADRFLQGKPSVWTGLFLVGIYFTVFSNLASSGILAAYAGSCLLLHLIRMRKSFRLSEYLKQNYLYLLILFGWAVSALFELSGGRASSAEGISLMSNIRLSASSFVSVLLECSQAFWWCVAAVAVPALACFLYDRVKGDAQPILSSVLLTMAVAAAALVVYTILLCAVVYPTYIYRSEYMFSPFFYILLPSALALGYLLRKFPALTAVCPMVLLLLATSINTPGKTFREPNMSNWDGAVCTKISQDIVEQVLTADAQGLDEMTLYVPLCVEDLETQDNWPFSLSLVPRISETLYEQGLISRPIHIQAEASIAFNIRHHLPIPGEDS